MTDTTNATGPSLSLHVELSKQDELYDLHTHLMGMGSADFWINTILLNETILPINKHFQDDVIRKRLGPLIWDKNSNAFYAREHVATVVYNLREDPNGPTYIPGSVHKAIFDELHIQELGREMDHLGLSFKEDFSYDVVLKRDDLKKAFSLSNSNSDVVQMILEERLGVYEQTEPYRSPFKHWIIFNARKQKLEIVCGMTVEELRKLIDGESAMEHIYNPVQRDARAHIINAFSMCNADGTLPRSIDYHSFRGQFTPEFYPRRFALKDSLYEQRLDLLALLLQHVLQRYMTCSPPVTYCEFSVGVGDLSKPWIFDILSSFLSQKDDAYFKESSLPNTETSFRKLIKDFPWLKSEFVNVVTYRFLAGFNRQCINLTDVANNDPVNGDPDDIEIEQYKQEEAIQLLAKAPQEAIHRMLSEIIKSKEGMPSTRFESLEKKLEKLEDVEKKFVNFYHWVVGLDLCGDELGYPYCPFVSKKFIRHVNKVRNANDGNPNYGLRIHGGENVAAVNSTLPGYHLFVSHMYIVVLSIQYLQQELKHGIRIGHGVAFDIILNYNEEKENPSQRKSSVLMAEMKRILKKILKTIPVEVNITSNYYLLGQSVRRGNGKKTHSLKTFFDVGIPIVLSTDNDGIWPIDQCLLKHVGHHSVAAEFCRAIYSGIIINEGNLGNVIKNSKTYCFDKELGTLRQTDTKKKEPEEEFQIPMVVLHPKLISYIMKTFYKVAPVNGNNPFYEYCKARNGELTDDKYELSDEKCIALAPVALAITYLTHSEWAQLNSCKPEYDIMFANSQNNQSKNFETVRKECKNIYNKFMKGNVINLTADHDMTITEDDNSFTSVKFMSIPPSSEISTLKQIAEQVTQSENKVSIIFGFCSTLDIKETVKYLKKKLESNNTGETNQEGRNALSTNSGTIKSKVTVYLHSNLNKYAYADATIDDKITLKINYHPDKRTNCDEETEMHALYVIGPHGSAATAALHHIPKLMDTCTSNSNDPQQQRPGSVGPSSENYSNKPADGNNKPKADNNERKDDNNQRKDDNNQRKDDHSLVLMLASSETVSRTTNTSDPKSDKCFDLKSYKRLHIVPSFEQLIIPFLRMTVNIPFSPNSDFYELYGIDKSSKLHTKFDFKDAYTLSYHIDQEYEMLFDDAIHSQMDWSTLYRDFGTNTWSNDLISTIFQMASDSLEKYDVYPARIALLHTTSERTNLIKKLKKSTYNILVPIKEFNNETKLLVCTQIQRFPCKPSNIEFWNKDESSFKLAYVLWINFTHGKPFTSPYCELNNSIVVYHTDKLLEVGKQCKQAAADDVWGYVIFLTVNEAAKETWNPITVNKWCDFLYDALPNNESIEKFSAFLSKHNLVKTFKSVLENTSPGKLRNDEQYDVIKKRKAYKIQTMLSKACQPSKLLFERFLIHRVLN
ncbi:unnamed protein product [Rotaria magnacalcarata]|uniref:Adenosine deaminase n=1 Tax=Rotaria magnacalcarata TaxID=392030 RepID=A0A816LUT3_9BILA|nr:unnamed protein product [Rotaria magnacalcarata]CAF4058241.1 unnamed protein product [Rotaria magnacalcarata]